MSSEYEGIMRGLMEVARMRGIENPEEIRRQIEKEVGLTESYNDDLTEEEVFPYMDHTDGKESSMSEALFDLHNLKEDYDYDFIYSFCKQNKELLDYLEDK